MKLFYFIFGVCLLVFVSCKEHNTEVSTNDVMNSQSADGKGASSLPEIKFEEETHDFGRITQGEKVTCAFKFKNTGGSNLIISAANGSCGCTVPKFPTKPIAPGQEGVIDVIFASEGKSGIVEKSVTVVTNCEPSTRIVYIKADIVVPTNANPNQLPVAQ